MGWSGRAPAPPAIEAGKGRQDKEHAMSQTLNAAIAVIGIDIGKNSFHVVGHDERGAMVLRQKWSRGQVETRLRRNFFRVHCQFVSGNDRRTSYDYFMLTCGPISAKSQTLAPDGAVSMIADDGGLIASAPLSETELLGSPGAAAQFK